MDVTFKTAAQIRALMPQARPEEFVQDILDQIQVLAKMGQNRMKVYESSTNRNGAIPDISKFAMGGRNTVAGAVSDTLTNLGFVVHKYSANSIDPREPVPGYLEISW